jgi:hypothetical protein
MEILTEQCRTYTNGYLNYKNSDKYLSDKQKKNNLYKTDPDFKERQKKRNLERYHKEKQKKQELIQKLAEFMANTNPKN